MVSLTAVQKSNARIKTLPKGLVGLFIGATSGIGLSALQNFAQHASSPFIYTVAGAPTVTFHEDVLVYLWQSNPTGTYNINTADVSLVSDIDKVVNTIKQKETKVDILFISTDFKGFEDRMDTGEGLDSSMTTRYLRITRDFEQSSICFLCSTMLLHSAHESFLCWSAGWDGHLMNKT